MILHFEDLTVGKKALLCKRFSEEDVLLFAKLSGDYNPIHIDEEFAKQSQFGQRVVHGALTSSIFSSMFASQLPALGCIYLVSNVKFLKPVFLNQDVLFQVEIIEINKDKRRVTLAISANVETKVVIVGNAELLIPE